MGTIKNFIENIKKARYGKDVRQSIVDALEQTYDDAIANGHTDMEVVKARDKYDNLNSRLEADKTEIIESINKEAENRKNADENLQSQINGLASGSPLVANSVSEMTDTSRVYVNTSDGHWYTYNGTSWVDGGVYQATEITDGSIKVEKTDFAERINYFNHLIAKPGRIQKYVNNSYDNIDATSSTTYKYSDLYKINEGDVVRVKYPNSATFTLGLVWCNESKKIIKVDLFGNWSTFAEYTAPENAKYFEFDFNISNQVADWTKEVMCTINKEMPSEFVEYKKYILENCEQVIELEKEMNVIKNKIKNVSYDPSEKAYILKDYVGQRKIQFKNLLIGYNYSNYRLQSRVKDYQNNGYCGNYIAFKDNASLTKPFSLIKKDDVNNTELSYKNIIVYSVDPTVKNNPETVQNVWIIGDSFTQAGYLPWHIQNFIKNYCGFSNFNFIGHKTFSNEDIVVKHSGCGGYTVKDFIKTDNTEGRGTTFPNPFLKNDAVAISNAISEKPDICILELGVNDILDNHTTSQLTNDLSELISIIKESNQNCIFYLVGYIYMSENNNSFNDVSHNLKIQEFNKALEIFANSNSYNFVDVAIMFNRDIGYIYENRETYPGSNEYIKNQTDYLHPSNIGYKMEAENISAKIISDLDDKKENDE